MFLLCPTVLAEQEAETQDFDPGKKFAVKELKDDFRLLRTALEEGHGGLYRYTPKPELDQQFETILGKLSQPLTAREFLLHLAPLIANKHLEVKQNKHSFWTYTNVPEGEKELASSIKKNNRGTYDVDESKHPNLGIQQPLKPTFKGNVFILIDGRSFSATGECTSLIHFYKKARFVGEECGAGYYGNTSGFMVLLTLPNTRLRIRIPMVKYAMAVSGYPPDRGLIPDYPVVPKMSDLLNGRDTEMEFVLELIKEKYQDGV